MTRICAPRYRPAGSEQRAWVRAAAHDQHDFASAAERCAQKLQR